MTITPSSPSVSGRMLLATVLLIGLLAVAGCSTTDDYATETGDPTTGAVIETLSIVDINEMDGARYELQYSLNASDTAAYNVEVYELTDDEAEFVSVSDLNSGESQYRNDVPPPWDAGETRRYELRIVDEADGTVVDTISFRITKEGA